MANEATLHISMEISNIVCGSLSGLNYRSSPVSFVADVAGQSGPLPGEFTATVAGTDVDLSLVTNPRLCRIENLDETNFVTFGIWDITATTFFPVGELLPGEFYIIRLSRMLTEEISGTGTGTTGLGNSLRVKADTASCQVNVEVFEL